jgi:hypothetical protein
VNLLNYSLKHGYSFQRWQNIVNVMIQKDPGTTKMHRLPVIHIYGANYNLLLGFKWRQMLHHGEKNQTIHQGQHGGRPGHEATTLILMEGLKNDIAYASRKSLINFNNDAASCYDRIIPALASLLERGQGLHRNVIFVNARTLKQAKYKLRTSTGVSAKFYSHCHAFPIYGTGQGSGNSPFIWCIISSTLFRCHEAKSHGATFSTPDKSTSVSLSMVGFVDDSTGQVNDFDNPIQPTPKELSEIMKHEAKLWNDLLWISGGLLELDKCSYHHIHFDFDVDGNASLRLGHVGPPITIPDNQSHAQIQIPSKSVLNSQKTLGHYKAPTGTGATQLQILKKKSNTLGQQVSTGPFNKHDA